MPISQSLFHPVSQQRLLLKEKIREGGNRKETDPEARHARKPRKETDPEVRHIRKVRIEADLEVRLTRKTWIETDPRVQSTKNIQIGDVLRVKNADEKKDVIAGIGIP